MDTPKPSSTKPTPNATTRSRLSLVIVCIIIAAVLIAIILKFVMPNDSTTTTTTTSQQNQNTISLVNTSVNTSEYQDEVNHLIEDYEFTDSAMAKTIQQELLPLGVPADLKSFHLQLVSILQDVQDGKVDQAQTRLQSLRTQYSWLK